MLIEPVSYKSPKHECSETFSYVLNHSGTPKVGKSFALRRGRMNKKLITLLASCVLASSISVFAQDAAKQDGMQKDETKQNEMKQDSMGKDEMKQDSMGNDSMKHDEMTEGKKQKQTHKSKKTSKKDAMGKDEMKHGDNMKQSDSMQKEEMQH